MLVYEVIEYLWAPTYLWEDGIWRRERPPYRELGYRVGWYTERPPYRELDQRTRQFWISMSSPSGQAVKPTSQTSCGKQVISLDANGDEYEKLSHARDVKQFGSISDFMVVRNKRTGEVLHLNVRYAGFGVSVNRGKFILRQKRERG